MKTVYKYRFEIADRVLVHMPAGAAILRVGLDPQGAPALWAHVDTSNDDESRDLAVTGTGHPVPDGLTHLGSFVQGPFVWHVWERI